MMPMTLGTALDFYSKVKGTGPLGMRLLMAGSDDDLFEFACAALALVGDRLVEMTGVAENLSEVNDAMHELLTRQISGLDSTVCWGRCDTQGSNHIHVTPPDPQEATEPLFLHDPDTDTWTWTDNPRAGERLPEVIDGSLVVPYGADVNPSTVPHHILTGEPPIITNNVMLDTQLPGDSVVWTGSPKNYWDNMEAVNHEIAVEWSRLAPGSANAAGTSIEVQAAEIPAPPAWTCKHGANTGPSMAHCPLGFPGCHCADDLIAEEWTPPYVIVDHGCSHCGGGETHDPLCPFGGA